MASEVRIREAGPSVTIFRHAEPPRSQSEAAYFLIRDRILSPRRCRRARWCTRRSCARSSSIGRTPIREALQRLAHEKLVRSVPHRGTFVTDVNITDLARITEVRVVLEGHAARLAAERGTRRRPGGDAELLAALGSVERDRPARADEARPGDPPQHLPRARNSFLESTLERYFNLSLRLWFLVPRPRRAAARGGRRAQSTLLEAILAGDGDRAETIMRRHVAGFEREIRKVLVER